MSTIDRQEFSSNVQKFIRCKDVLKKDGKNKTIRSEFKEAQEYVTQAMLQLNQPCIEVGKQFIVLVTRQVKPKLNDEFLLWAYENFEQYRLDTDPARDKSVKFVSYVKHVRDKASQPVYSVDISATRPQAVILDDVVKNIGFGG